MKKKFTKSIFNENKHLFMILYVLSKKSQRRHHKKFVFLYNEYVCHP